MKRVNLFFIAAFVAVSAMMFVGCADDPDVDNPQVSVRYKVGGETDWNNLTLISGKGEIEEPLGTMLEFEIKYSMGKTYLELIRLSSQIGVDEIIVEEKTFGQSSGTNDQTMSYFTSIGNSTETLKIYAEDGKNQPRTTTVNVTIKVKAEPDPEPPTDITAGYFYTLGAVIQLGAQSHTSLPSFFSFGQTKTFMLRGAMEESQTSPSAVDVACYNSSGITFGSPSLFVSPTNRPVAFSQTASLNPDSWNFKNVTGFYKVTGETGTVLNEWTPGWYDDAIEEASKAAAPASIGLSVNDVVAFKTQSGATGAFIVTAANAANTGSVSFRIISQHEVED